MPTATAEAHARYEAKSKELAGILAEAGDERDFAKVASLAGDTAAKHAEFLRRNTELGALWDAYKAAYDIDKAADTLEDRGRFLAEPAGKMTFPAGTVDGKSGGHARAERKSPGELFIESDGYKGWVRGRGGQAAGLDVPGLGVKATFTTTASTLTQYDRQAGIVLVGNERLTVADLLAQAQTTMNTVRYVREDTYTNAATTVAEEGTKPEATFDTSEQDAPVRKIAVIGKVTDEMWSDFPVIRDYINNRLRFMVQEREEAQLINGNGTAPNLRGILQTAGIQTQAKGTDPGPDAVYKAFTKIRTVGFFEPDGLIAHPNDWQEMRLLRTVADGPYLWGPPTEAGPERIWGKPVVVTTAIPENTMLAGAFKLGAQVFFREGVTVESTNSDQDDFVKNRIAIRVEERIALAVYRPLAFCSVTGM